MAVVTIDAKGELESLQADIDRQAQVDGIELGAANKTLADTKARDAETKAPATEIKSVDGETKAAETETADAEDIEAEDGLTPREKQDLLAVQRKDLPHSVQRVIAKRVAQRKAAEEFAAAQYAEKRLAEQRAAAIERELAELKAKMAPAQEAKPETDAGKPQREKFANDEAGNTAYWEAMTDWRVEQKLKEQRAKDEQARQLARQAEVTAQAEKRINEAAQLVPDFLEVTKGPVGEIRLHEAVLGYIEQSDMIAELTYHLFKNPEVAEKLSKLPPAGQLVTIGKIESSLKPFVAKTAASKDSNGATPGKTEASTSGKQSTTAPSEDTGIAPGRARDAAPIIKPLNGSGAAAVEIDPRDMNTREMIADWQKHHKANFSLRKRH